MALKQSLLLLTPLLIVLIVSLSFIQGPKDPALILSSSKDKIDDYESLIVESEVIIDLGVFGSAMAYLSNITSASLNGMKYSRIETQTPFSSIITVNEQFVLPIGNFTCTNSLLRPVCVEENDSLNTGFDTLSSSNYSSFEFLGSKRVGGRLCDALFSVVNLSDQVDFIDEFISQDELSSINEAFAYSCIDPITGLNIESLWGISGVSNIQGMMMDVSINISKTVSSYSFEVPESLFILPYDVISYEDFELLVNETYDPLLSQNL